jgi:hypothetical protein
VVFVKKFVLAFLSTVAAVSTILGQNTQPVVAIHDSELTRALETMPATPPTPMLTSNQWWATAWHYFVMPDSVKEALHSDGTAFTVVGDSNITAGALLNNGRPTYPIVISLASEAVRNDEIGPLTNYVAAGGFLFVGSSAFTRNTDGTTRGDFAFASQLGVHMVVPGLTNWGLNVHFSKTNQPTHPLVNDFPSGQLQWQLANSADEIPWGVSPTHYLGGAHFAWQVQAGDATTLATGDSYPYLLVKPFGKGYFIYYAPMQPLIGHGGPAPGMYMYLIFRRAIEWAFQSFKMPVPKLSPWPYAFDAAFMVRHDLEDYTNEVADINLSAGMEYTNGAWGDYYFCTGTLRVDAAHGGYNTNTIVNNLRTAVSSYGATIAPHNGGLKNPNNTNLVNANYDYWHWGPDEALDVTPTNFTSGKAYALTSISNSFVDIEYWLNGLTNGVRCWVSPYFNATREPSYGILTQLGVRFTGEQKLSPFPSWSLSTKTPGLRYGLLSEPVSDWYVGTAFAETLEAGHNPTSMHTCVDFYYNLGFLINLYNHTLSTGEGPAGPLAMSYVTYGVNTNLHSRLWSTNGLGVYRWWLQRSNAQISATYTSSGNLSTTTFTINGAADSRTSIELLAPNASYYNLQVTTNGVLAGPTCYRTNGQVIKVQVGATVATAVVSYQLASTAQNDYYTIPAGTQLSAPAPGVLTNDSVGVGGTNLTAIQASNPASGALSLSSSGAFTYTPTNNFIGVDSFGYQTFDGLTTSSVGSAVIFVTPANAMFYDTFARPTNVTALTPWQTNSGSWTITNGLLQGRSPLQSYGSAYLTNLWTNFTVQANIQFPAGAFGGGLSGCLNPVTGARYTAWLYPESTPGGPATLSLIKFTGWTTWGPNPMAQVSLPSVSNNLHNLQLVCVEGQLSVYFDGPLVINQADTNFGGIAPYGGGGASVDMFTAGSSYTMAVGDMLVTPAYGPPVANSNSYKVTANQFLTVPPPGVLSNAMFGTPPLSAILVSGPSQGAAFNLNPNGGFTYLPATNFTGTDSFTFRAYDSQTNSNIATATITVTPPLPLIASSGAYATSMGVPLVVPAPGVLTNVSGGDGHQIAILVAGPSQGALNLNANGGFSYTPTNGFFGVDAFTYSAVDGQSNSAPAVITINVLGGGQSFYDGFARATDPGPLSPWLPQSGNWGVTGGILQGDATPLPSYDLVYVTNSWTNCAVQCQIQFPTINDYGGGVGACLNPATGVRYSAWVYPENSPVGSRVLRLIKWQDWTTWGYQGRTDLPIATVSLAGVGTNWHLLKLACYTNQLAAYYDGQRVLTAQDVEPQPLLGGGISAETWFASESYAMNMDNVSVSPLVANDHYTMNSNTVLAVAAPGVLANDTEVFGASLSASVLSLPTNGTVNLTNNGGFTYTPSANFTGTDCFVYQAADGAANLGSATVMIMVGAAQPPGFALLSIGAANGVTTLTWSSEPGRTYRLQYKDAIAATNWSDVTPDVVAYTSTTTATNSAGNTGQRFYRILRIN